MTATRVRAGRVNGYADIVERIKAAVIHSTVKPGARLPTRRELIRRFVTTPVTVHRAMKVLAEHGYVRADGPHGTFVADFPPHISHYAMAFPAAEGHAYHQFYIALQNEGARLRNPERQVSMFYNINVSPESPNCRRLLKYVEAHRVAGVIFTFAPFALKGSPLVEDPGICRVVIRTPMPGSRTADVYPDLAEFLHKALDHLSRQGRRSAAILCASVADSAADAISRFIAVARRYGIAVKPQWVQAVHAQAAPWARQTMLAVFSAPKSQRPDSLIITDDNLVEAATGGLAASGLRIRGDLEVIAHTNFPWPTKAHFPVTRLGFDIRRLVAVCIERIDQQRLGKVVPMATSLPPVFEKDLCPVAPPVRKDSHGSVPSGRLPP